MKFQLTFKTPDVINQINAADYIDILPGDEEYAYAKEDKKKEIKTFLEKWISYGECITIEFDTDKNTAVVL